MNCDQCSSYVNRAQTKAARGNLPECRPARGCFALTRANPGHPKREARRNGEGASMARIQQHSVHGVIALKLGMAVYRGNITRKVFLLK